jgi:hypothetical protein
MDDHVLGAFAWSMGDTGTHVPAVYAESSSPAPRDSGGGTLGPVDFQDFAVRLNGQLRDQPVSQGTPSYNAANVCPPFGLRADGHGGLLMGSGLPCPGELTTLQWG